MLFHSPVVLLSQKGKKIILLFDVIKNYNSRLFRNSFVLLLDFLDNVA